MHLQKNCKKRTYGFGRCHKSRIVECTDIIGVLVCTQIWSIWEINHLVWTSTETNQRKDHLSDFGFVESVKRELRVKKVVWVEILFVLFEFQFEFQFEFEGFGRKCNGGV